LFNWNLLISGGGGKKIAFVNPPFYKNGRWGVRAGSRWSHTGNTPNYGYCPYPHFLGYGASYIESLGNTVMFYDAIAWRHTYEVFYEALREFQPDIIVQEISTASFYIDMEIALELSKISKVCLVGTHATTFAEELIKLTYISYVVKGTYEVGVREILLSGLDGVYGYYSMIHPDELPYPVREEYMNRDCSTGFLENTGEHTMYYDPICQKKIDEPMLFVNASRGCPHVCDFCLWTNVMYENKCKLRSPDKVISEVDFCMSNFNSKYVYFDDDTWNIGGEHRIESLCRGMKELEIPWGMMGRLDGCSRDMWKLIVDSGCVGIRLGVESVSQKQLERMEKRENVDDIKNMVRWMKTLGTDLFLCCMHGFPGETDEDRLATKEFIKEIGHNSQNPQCIPFPGTPYYDKVKKLGFKCDDWSEYDAGNASKRLVESLAGCVE